MHIIKSNNAYYYYNSRNHIPLALAHPDTNLNEHEHSDSFFKFFTYTSRKDSCESYSATV